MDPPFMSYFIDEQVPLKDLKKRIGDTDLVPSRSSLKEGIDKKFEDLERSGYRTLSDLRNALKNARRIPAVSKETGIEEHYLILLRREIESYFPKPFPLGSFTLVDDTVIKKLEKEGIKNTKVLYEALRKGDLPGIDPETKGTLSHLSDLTRIQWTNPTAAMMLLEAGYEDARSVAKADPDTLCKDLERVNKNHRFFKGKIGLRDVKRLVKSASYLDP